MEKNNNILEISKIKNLESVKIDRLMDTREKEDPGVIVVFYDDGKKTIAYSELESEYLYLFSTVRRVYNEEKNNRRIIIDDLSKKILESNEPKIELETLKQEIGSIGTSKKINYKIKTVEMYYNLLKFGLETLFKYFNRHIIITNIKGMNKHFKFIYKEDNLEKSMPFTFIEKEDGTLSFIFPGVFDNTKELYIDLKYDEKIEINIYDENYKIHFNYEYITTTEYGKEIKSLYIGGILTSQIIESLEITSDKEITYVLPWGDTRSVYYTKTNEELISVTTKYIDYFESPNKDHKMTKEKIIKQVTKQGFRKKMLDGFYKIEGDLTLKTDDEIIITNYYLVDEYIIKETTYLSTLLTRGKYKSELEGKTFYKILKQEETILNDVPENIKGYELINENELKLLLRRREN